MPSHIALLRGINVGGSKPIPMAALRDLLEKIGLSEVKTLLQSGNVVFQTKATSDPAALETLLETKATQHFYHPIDFFVRTATDWRSIIAHNPFPKEAKDDPTHLLVMCLKTKPNLEALNSLKSAIKDREYFKTHGRELYLVYPDGIGRSRLTTALIESKLSTRGTARNWNTVQKLAALSTAK